MKAVRWLVSGRVQGVGFRHFTRESASVLGLRGTVRNLADGTVEVVVSGPESAVAALKARLSEGPTWAEVHRVDQTELEVSDLPAFQVRF